VLACDGREGRRRSLYNRMAALRLCRWPRRTSLWRYSHRIRPAAFVAVLCAVTVAGCSYRLRSSRRTITIHRRQARSPLHRRPRPTIIRLHRHGWNSILPMRERPFQMSCCVAARTRASLGKIRKPAQAAISCRWRPPIPRRVCPAGTSLPATCMESRKTGTNGPPAAPLTAPGKYSGLNRLNRAEQTLVAAVPQFACIAGPTFYAHIEEAIKVGWAGRSSFEVECIGDARSL
jgi:hypothetical protein